METCGSTKHDLCLTTTAECARHHNYKLVAIYSLTKHFKNDIVIIRGCLGQENIY